MLVLCLIYIFDLDFRFDQQINSEVRSYSSHFSDQVIHAIISTPCAWAWNDNSLAQWQQVRNAVDRMLTGTKKRDHSGFSFTPMASCLLQDPFQSTFISF